MSTWTVEEYTATFDDHDKEYVGKLDANGLFTPNVDGPNPKRRGNGNNVGDVWVVATYKTAEGKTAVAARAHLLVTMPLYVRVRPGGGGPMTAAANIIRFRRRDSEFVYLVPSAAVFELDDAACAIEVGLGAVASRRRSGGWRRRFPRADIETLRELCSVQAIADASPLRRRSSCPPANFPLTTMVLNVTNQCNLSVHVLLRIRRGQDCRYGRTAGRRSS